MATSYVEESLWEIEQKLDEPYEAFYMPQVLTPEDLLVSLAKLPHAGN